MREGDIEDAAFHLQQGMEKALKSFLIAHGWELKRIHDLEVLLDDAVNFQPALEQYRAICGQVNDYYLAERYPGMGKIPPAEELESTLPQAEAILKMLEEGVAQAIESFAKQIDEESGMKK